MSGIITGRNWQTIIYADTSFLLSRKNMRFLDGAENVRLIPEVIQEVRDGRDVLFNSLLDDLLKRSLVVSRDTFDQVSGSTVYDHLFNFASSLHPYLRARIDEIDSLPLPPKESYLRKMQAVDQVSRAGAIWQADFKEWTKRESKEHCPRGRYDSLIRHKDGLSVDSWYKYHRNRFKGLLRHNYRWTDEKIVATAATEAFVCRKRVIIATQDSDFHAIFWQFSNNFVMFKLLRCIRDQQISPSEFWRQFSELCEAYNSFYLKMIEQRSQAAISELHAKNKGIHPVIVNLRATTTKDIAVHYQARKIVDVFIYPEEMIQELLNAAGIIRNA